MSKKDTNYKFTMDIVPESYLLIRTASQHLTQWKHSVYLIRPCFHSFKNYLTMKNQISRLLMFYETREQNGFKRNIQLNPRTPILCQMPWQALGRKKQLLDHTGKQRCLTDNCDPSDKCCDQEFCSVISVSVNFWSGSSHLPKKKKQTKKQKTKKNPCMRKCHLSAPLEMTIYHVVTYLDNFTRYYPTDDIEGL